MEDKVGVSDTDKKPVPEKQPPTYTRELIKDAAIQRRKLVDIVYKTQGAKAALEQTTADLHLLQDKQKKARETLEGTRDTAQREKDEWIKAKGQHLRKLFQRKEYNVEVDKEKAEYLAAHEWELRAEAAVKALNTQIKELTASEHHLNNQVKQYNEAQLGLEKLYNEIFSGPSHEHPEEDRLEEQYNSLKKSIDDVQPHITHVSHVCDALRPAKANLLTAWSTIDRSYDDTMDEIGRSVLHWTKILATPPMLITGRGSGSNNSKDDHSGHVLTRVRYWLAKADQDIIVAQTLDPSVLARIPKLHPLIGDTGILDSVSELVNMPLADSVAQAKLQELAEVLLAWGEVVAWETMMWHDRLKAFKAQKDDFQQQLAVVHKDLFRLRGIIFDKETLKLPSVFRRRADSF